MDVVERVALLLKAKLAEQLDATPLHQPGDWSANGGEINLTELSRAAIAAVLDSMAEPSEAFLGDGLAGIVNFDGSDFHVGPAKAVIAEMVWKAVHKAMRAEMLGATGETEV